MNETPQATELKAALLHFENLMGMPPESEDVPDWIEQVKPAFQRLEVLVQVRRRRIHDKLFCEIADLDPSRREQIERLKSVDRDIEKFLDVIRSHVIVLGLPKSEPQEDGLDEHVADFVDRATELVYWIKAQEETVAEWFAEAFAAEA